MVVCNDIHSTGGERALREFAVVVVGHRCQ